MRILVVKLSSLGDVVHTLPAVQDIVRAVPHATIDWVVERGFAPLVQRCEGVRRVIPSELRRWRRALLAPATRAEWSAFRSRLREVEYDAVIDLQGLTKSAVVSRVARVSRQGRRYAMANRTDGASYELPTRWVADVAVRVEPRIHAMTRAREICARALGYEVPADLRYGLSVHPPEKAGAKPCIALIHGSSRADKCWPEASWAALAGRLVQQGFEVALPHGTDEELATSQRLAARIGPAATVWPRLSLDALLDRMAGCAGAIGVDSGLSHIAVALGLAHVQIYNFDTAWRTGPLDTPHQASVFARPTPVVPEVWDAWTRVGQSTIAR
ncbi:MAG TPA: lipopolysaccharide heptosyltransferase I [Ramlibacter sp.]|uniref:lipopolysaccharide heptosyltransferase I n=1 Tax=Ramlibacter sp. TaxID=1917967 RepID=UPI002BF7ABB0|nr:lipopolysaccharide heptosyltransferase I [Ramlibacter sp.]HVZ46631.1 lipopolysaccharide heptosyltransferase I [Ramlibacter sp.]